MVKTGVEILLADKNQALMSRRVGFVSHAAAVLPDLTLSLDALLKAGFPIMALFGPEHGFQGSHEDAKCVDHTRDPRTGLPVFSLYGAVHEPTEEMLAGVDVLLFDMQDVGVRFYTFLSTLYYVLKAAGKYNKPVWVADRPNPLGGERMEGPVLRNSLQSFIGILPMPLRHGLTFGELAGWINRYCQFNAELHILPMTGWKRAMPFEQTGLPWVMTSPAMPHLSTVNVYPGTCLFEGCNLSEGRGTSLPFEVIGAPWIDPFLLAEQMNGLNIPAVRFRPLYFLPYAGKFAGQQCGGVQLHVSDWRVFKPLSAGLWLMKFCREQNTQQFEFLESSWEGTSPHFDLLMGYPEATKDIENGKDIQQLVESWRPEQETFKDSSADFRLYS